jgi:hypothetical protein
MWQQWRRSRKRKDGIKLSFPPKLLEKLLRSQLYCFVKFSFSITHLMPYYAVKLTILAQDLYR